MCTDFIPLAPVHVKEMKLKIFKLNVLHLQKVGLLYGCYINVLFSTLYTQDI